MASPLPKTKAPAFVKENRDLRQQFAQMNAFTSERIAKGGKNPLAAGSSGLVAKAVSGWPRQSYRPPEKGEYSPTQ